MANPRLQANEEKPKGGIASMIGAVLTAPATMIAKAFGAIMADGTIAAAARQGIDELGAALKAFPDSIQREEVGTLWTPTQAEITASRRQGGGVASHQRQPWPSEIAEHNRQHPRQDHGHGKDHGHDMGHSM